MSVGSSNRIYDRNRRRCSESVFSRICTGVSRGASRGGSTGVGTTEGRAGQGSDGGSNEESTDWDNCLSKNNGW